MIPDVYHGEFKEIGIPNFDLRPVKPDMSDGKFKDRLIEEFIWIP